MEIARASVYVLAFGGAFLIWGYKKRLDTSFHWVGWYLLFNGIAQVTGFLLALYFKSNFLWYNVTLIFIFGLIFLILFFLLNTVNYRKRLTLVFSLMAIVFLFFSLTDFTNNFTTRALTILNLTVVLGCLLYYYELLRIPENTPITHQGKFWIAAAFLIYHLSSFAFWLIYELSFHKSTEQFFSAVNFALVILLYIMLISAVFIQLKSKHYAKYQ